MSVGAGALVLQGFDKSCVTHSSSGNCSASGSSRGLRGLASGIFLYESLSAWVRFRHLLPASAPKAFKSPGLFAASAISFLWTFTQAMYLVIGFAFYAVPLAVGAGAGPSP